MKNFSNYSKLKAVSLAFIATQLPSKEIEELGELFKQINTLNNGFLSVNEIEAALKAQGIQLTYNELHRVLKVMDMDKNGKIDFNEFVACCMDSHAYCRKDYLDYIFSHFDRDGNGKISRAELYDEIEKMGLQLPGRLVN
jgi:calcium-dependent protein kinase